MDPPWCDAPRCRDRLRGKSNLLKDCNLCRPASPASSL